MVLNLARNFQNYFAKIQKFQPLNHLETMRTVKLDN